MNLPPAMRVHWPVLAGIIAVIVALPVLQVEYEAWHKTRHRAQMMLQPIITTQATMLERDEHSAVLRVTGIKHRDCAFIGVVATQFDARLQSDGASAERLDKPMAGATRPRGPFNAGTWRVTVPRAHGAMVEAVYECEGVIVRNLFVRVEANEVPPTDAQ